jgi:hypothetical protein
MRGKPDGRMRILIGFRHGQGLIELPVLARIGDSFLGPRLEDDFQCLGGHLPSLIIRDLPAHELVLESPKTGPKLQSAMGQMVKHGRLLR